MPKLQHDWQTRCLARRDPFAAHAGHDLPAVIHKAIDYGKRQRNQLVERAEVS